MATAKQILGKVVITNKGKWNSSNVYEVLDVVSYQGSSYMSKVYDNNSLPTEDSKWQLLAQKGDTYEVSETDIKNIAKQITENANSNFNKNVTEKTETFNSNAETKTTEFNENANTAVNSYDTNAEKKLKDYNENDTTKLKKYNDNASTKLNEYNTNSSDKLKEYNDNATKKISEYDEHSKELNEKADSTRKELDRVKNEILDQGEANGSFIHLEDSAMAELQELSIDGVLKQETTKGLNFWFNATKNQGESNGITFTLNKDFTYLLNGKNNGNGNSTCFLNSLSNQLFLKAGTYYTIKPPMPGISMTGIYVLDGVTKYIQLSSTTIDEFTLNQDVEMRTYLQVYQGINTTFNNVVLRPMISKQKITDSDYEPYTGGQPSPNVNFEQPIKVLTGSQNFISCNKNLFNKNDFKVLEGYYIGTNGNVGQATTNNIIYMPIKSNTSYSIQKVSSNRFRVGTYSNLEVLGKILNNVIKNLDDSIVSYTLNNTNDKYLFFQYLGGDTNEQEILDSIQIEEGSISTKYTDHQESSLTFDIPEREFVGYIDNTYKDELAVIYNVTDGQFHKILKKKVGKLVITDENKNKFIESMNNSFKIPAVLISKEKIGWKTSWDKNIVKSNRYSQITAVSEIDDCKISSNITNQYIIIFDERFTDLQTARDLLVDTEIYTALANEYEVDLGVCDMPITFNKISNLFVDNELSPEINIKYYRNFKDTIKNLQENKQDNLVAGEDIIISGNTVDVSKNLKQRTIETRNELERIKTNVLNTGNANDTYIHLEDSAMAEFQELSICGVLGQETTKGLNHLDTNNLKTITNNGITYTPVYNENGTLKYVNVNGTATDNSAYTVHEGTRYSVDKAKSYLVSGCPAGGSSSTYSVLTYCYDENNTYFSGIYDNGSGAVVSQATFVWLNIDIKKGVTLNNAKFYPMLSEGTEKVEYEPYTNLLPSPSPEYEQPIKVLANNLKVVSCNENLVNLFAEVLHNVSYNLTTGINLKEQKSNINGSHIVSKNRLTINVPQAWGYYIDYIIPVKPNTKYYVSVDNISTNGLKFSDYVLDEDFNIIGVWYISQNNIPNHSITASAKAKYICLGFSSGVANSTIILENLQLKEENTVEFKEHQESSLTFDIPEGEFAGYIDDTYKDELSVVYNEEDGQFHKILKKKVGKIVFDGSENGWWLHTSGGFAKLVQNAKYGSVKCNNFTSKLFTEDKTIYAYSDGYIKIRYDKFTTLDEFKNWLSTNKTEVYYRLAEPYEIDLGICDMPFSYDKVTNIFTDNELNPVINAKYYRNFVKTIQNLQINEKELKQELIDINTRLSALETANNNAVSNSMQSEKMEVSE